ncbi:MAG TPA: aminomethyltransferase beta-barrel domain-containing protein, partial [Candidatus Kapabacteria bacterium]|nr:aminomethyltransferase beta-barrel domain-containing protein [Candidatus Kapabacteria bacterium]
KDFLQQYLPARPGRIVTDQGETIGEHQGLMYYTMGQRQGIGIGGVAHKGEAPWYVLGKNLETNELIVGQGTDHPWLFTSRLSTSDVNWVTGEPALPMRCRAKTRYRQPDQDCTVFARDNGNYEVIFDQPQRAVTPGQSVVFYVDDVCLGGGVIEHAWNP